MDVSSFLTALLGIVMIDLFLGGDNAIVIGLTARNFPEKRKKQVILWGTLASILVRSLATLLVVWLLNIPYLLAAGGVVLLWIAYQLLTEEHQAEESASANSLLGAIRTIVFADLVMGLDNVLAVAGAAQGSFLLVILGLFISIPIMIFGSTVIMRFMERFPFLIYVGAGIIAWTAGRMIADEPRFAPLFDPAWIHWGFTLFVTAAVLLVGRWQNVRRAARRSSPS
ncbi:TerC family protein [Brevibacillus fulvus]|uniref:YjbE family integral membrane protein n=1 Tax=Brevibacillus fulvus TaxID=1125967 RepID=A0A938XWS9_9BACL|nr:TerC family protein [Brevibacillus fulvus]MBM7589346.1 YjbE family integral membrane protein [Brevibacillus fulvus]